MKNSKVYFLMILSTVFWAGAFIAAKLSAPYIPVFTLTFLRFSIATVILYFIILIKDKRVYRLKREDIPVFLFTGIVGMFGYHTLFFTAVKYTTATNSSIIGASNPIITCVLCFIILRDKLSLKKWLGIFLSFTGVLITLTNGNLETLIKINLNKGDLLMLIAVCLWALYSIYSKKVMPRYSPITLTFYSFLFCSIILLPFVIYEKPLSLAGSIPMFSYGAVLYMSIFPSVIGYLVQQMSIKEIGPSKTSVFINLVPVFSMILSYIILHENITLIKVFAAALIISGVYISQK